ncbi:hypothetical protein ACQKWADRAFT_277667 [Trichoderma austrokoningii]
MVVLDRPPKKSSSFLLFFSPPRQKQATRVPSTTARGTGSVHRLEERGEKTRCLQTTDRTARASFQAVFLTRPPAACGTGHWFTDACDSVPGLEREPWKRRSRPFQPTWAAALLGRYRLLLAAARHLFGQVMPCLAGSSAACSLRMMV